jgi:hypothetical protein
MDMAIRSSSHPQPSTSRQHHLQLFHSSLLEIWQATRTKVQLSKCPSANINTVTTTNFSRNVDMAIHHASTHPQQLMSITQPEMPLKNLSHLCNS